MALPAEFLPIGFHEIDGVRVGHAALDGHPTGCTALLFDRMAPCGVDVRGGGPASRETALLSPLASAAGVHAVVLSGGSAYGLDCCQGVMRRLEERGVGFPAGASIVPLVVGSCIFDLRLCGAHRPDAATGYAAALDAERGSNPDQGNVGAGRGATVGKAAGDTRTMKGGFGSAAVRLGDLVVGAAFVANPLGNVYDTRTGQCLAGTRTEDGRAVADSTAILARAARTLRGFGGATNTTIGCVVTNAALTKAQATKVAGMAHDGMARAIRPVHTAWDGDTIYAASVGNVSADPSAVGIIAAEVTATAIARAVRAAQGLPGVPSARDLGTC